MVSEKDMPIGNTIATFFNKLGGAISVSVAQNIFSNTLIDQLRNNVPGVSPAAVINAGATHVREAVAPRELRGVLKAYSEATQRTFILPIACAGLAFIVSLTMEWKSVKGNKLSVPKEN